MDNSNSTYEELKDRLHRAYSTRRVLPNVQISEAALNRARSLHVPAKKRVPMEGIRSSSRATNSPSPSEIAQRTHRPPSVGGRPHRNLQKYRQASIVASSVTSSAISNSPLAPRLSPNLSHRGETRHQARSMKGNDKPEQRMRRQLPCKVVLPNNSNEEMDEGESVASTFDDFDYFCSISYSPSSKVAPNYTAETTQTRRQRMRGRRSHSMLHPNESVVDYSSPSTSFTTASSGKDHVVDKRVFSRTLTTYNQDIVEDITPKRMSGNASRNNSSVSLTQGSRASYSPGRPPITPQAPPKIPSGSRESPLGAAISQEALEADDPDLVEFKVQVVGSPSVGKSTICQRLASLNSEDSDDFNEDACEDLQTLSVKATLNGKVFNVGFVETAMYAAEDAMNIEIQECVDAFVVVYAIDDDSTFEFARRVLLVLRESVRENSLPPAGFILVGNKSDLVRGREVPTDGQSGGKEVLSEFTALSTELLTREKEINLQHLKRLNLLKFPLCWITKYLNSFSQSSPTFEGWKRLKHNDPNDHRPMNSGAQVERSLSRWLPVEVAALVVMVAVEEEVVQAVVVDWEEEAAVEVTLFPESVKNLPKTRLSNSSRDTSPSPLWKTPCVAERWVMVLRRRHLILSDSCQKGAQ
ncbi:GTP-binding protein REM 1 [Echinococcus granulosus]|uniref:GTP binding protein REM 1 n=1 Tax=Echinococcus granulosus TaxID=6210 RepID=A0A068WMM8_ECHGR|nr:GTP-binding protein REM 1 [Echinococcus granulosus]CDS18883.1 GTP binding protein REM 1 [Echinococcus granulosus]